MRASGTPLQSWDGTCTVFTHLAGAVELRDAIDEAPYVDAYHAPLVVPNRPVGRWLAGRLRAQVPICSERTPRREV